MLYAENCCFLIASMDSMVTTRASKMYKTIPPVGYKQAHNLWIMSFSPKTGAIYIKKNNRFQGLDQQIYTGYYPFEIPFIFKVI